MGENIRSQGQSPDIECYFKLLENHNEKRNELPDFQTPFGNEYEKRCCGNFRNESTYQRKCHRQKFLKELGIHGEDNN